MEQKEPVKRLRGRPKVHYDLRVILALKTAKLGVRKIARKTGISKSKVSMVIREFEHQTESSGMRPKIN